MILRPASVSSLLLTCEHASRRLPPGAGADRKERQVLATHHGIDIGAWLLTTEIGRRLSATTLGGRWSRLWIDLNRGLDDPELIRKEAGGITLSWNRRLTPAERNRRVQAIHRPYHADIDLQIRRRVDGGVRPVLLSVHSFTDRFHGRTRGFDCGVLYDASAGHARKLAAALRQENFTVRYNEPYSGKLGMMYAIHRHGTAHRLPCLELEVNQARIDSRNKVARIAPAVTRAVARLL